MVFGLLTARGKIVVKQVYKEALIVLALEQVSLFIAYLRCQYYFAIHI